MINRTSTASGFQRTVGWPEILGQRSPAIASSRKLTLKVNGLSQKFQISDGLDVNHGVNLRLEG